MAKHEFLGVRETAFRLGVHENTVRNWVNTGILQAVRLPGSGFRRFKETDVEKVEELMLGGITPQSVGHMASGKDDEAVGVQSSARAKANA